MCNPGGYRPQTLEFQADFDAFGLLAVDGDANRDVLRLFADDPVLGPRLRPIVPSAAQPAPTVVQLPDTGEPEPPGTVCGPPR
jgi:hypothetical protein